MARTLTQLAIVRTVTWAHTAMSKLKMNPEELQGWYQRNHVPGWTPGGQIPGTFRGYSSGKHDPTSELGKSRTHLCIFDACNRESQEIPRAYYLPLFNLIEILDPLHWQSRKSQSIQRINSEKLCLDESLRSKDLPLFLLGNKPPSASELPIRPSFNNFEKDVPELPNPIAEIYAEMLRVLNFECRFSFFEFFQYESIQRRQNSIDIEGKLLLSLSRIDRLTMSVGLAAEAFFLCDSFRLKKAQYLVQHFLSGLRVKLLPVQIRPMLIELIQTRCLSLHAPDNLLKRAVGSPFPEPDNASENRGVAWIAAGEIQMGRLTKEEALSMWERLNPTVAKLRAEFENRARRRTQRR